MALPTRFTFTYKDLMELTDKSYLGICQDVRRQKLNCNNLESVIIWLARHARLDLRERILRFALLRELPERPGLSKRPKRRAKKSGK